VRGRGVPSLSEWRQFFSSEYGDPIPDQIQPDCVVAQTTADDWQAICDLIGASNWRWRYLDAHGVEAPLPSAVEALDADARHPVLIVWLMTGVGIVFYVDGPERIDFDFDLDEIRDQGSLDSLCDAVRRVGQAIRKDVQLSDQGGGAVFCEYRYEQDSFVFTTP